ncbi:MULTISPECIES: hypothetical protein [Streptomyces]|nr:hypothetical protein [Streptomyces justiciae]
MSVDSFTVLLDGFQVTGLLCVALDACVEDIAAAAPENNRTLT